MVRFIYGDSRTAYVETDLRSIQLIRDETYPIKYKEVKYRSYNTPLPTVYIPLQAKPFVELVNKIPDFEFDMLKPIAIISCNTVHVEIDYVRDDNISTLELGNIPSKPEYEYVAAFIRKCLDLEGYQTIHFCETFDSYIKHLIAADLKFGNDVFWNETAALLADRMLDLVLKKYGNKDGFEDFKPEEMWDMANEIMLDFLKKQ